MPYAEIPFTAAALRALATHWRLTADVAPERLYGGEESVTYGIGEYVVRLGPTWRLSSEAEWCHSIATYAASRLPEAIAPIPAHGGTTVVRVEDRPMSVWPLVQGGRPDVTEPGMCTQAADLLARLHQALADLRPPPRPVPSILEYWPDGDPPDSEPDFLDRQLDRWLVEFHRVNPNRQVVHGDYYPGNVLADQGKVVAILDWDDASFMAPESELASASMEWTGGMTVDLPAMRAFAHSYASAGGTGSLLDDETLVQFIRHRLRCEAMYFNLARERGVQHDEDDLAYHERRIAIFKDLRP